MAVPLSLLNPASAAKFTIGNPPSALPPGYGSTPTPTLLKTPTGAIANTVGVGTAATAPAPATPPPPSAADINKQAHDQVDGDTAAGKAYADSVLPDGTLSRLGSDPEVKAYLAQLKEREGGMTADELRAQYEQGTADSNGVLATNLARANQISGNAGVRGGAAAGLQMQALNHSIDDQAALQRQMTLDNIAQKNGAFAAYGNSLMGVTQYDAGQGDKEKVGRIQLAEEKGGQYDSARTGIKADNAAGAGLDWAKDYLKNLPAPGAAPGGDTATPTPAQVDKTVHEAIAPMTKKLISLGKPGDASPQDLDAFDSQIMDLVKENYPDLTPSQKTAKWKELGDSMRKAAGWTDFDITNRAQPSPPNSAVICTEALAQGLITQDAYKQLESGRPPGFFHADIAHYHAWGIPAAALMRKHPALARFIAWGLPATLNRLYGRPESRIRGFVGLAIFRTLNTLVKMSRRLRMEHA